MTLSICSWLMAHLILHGAIYIAVCMMCIFANNQVFSVRSFVCLFFLLCFITLSHMSYCMGYICSVHHLFPFIRFYKLHWCIWLILLCKSFAWFFWFISFLLLPSTILMKFHFLTNHKDEIAFASTFCSPAVKTMSVFSTCLPFAFIFYITSFVRSVFFFSRFVRSFCWYFKINLLAIDYLLARRPITNGIP